LVVRPRKNKGPHGGPFSVEREALDTVERGFWRGIWESAAPLLGERGLAIERFGPLQATTISALPQARFLNLVLGATAPGAVENGNLEAALGWAADRGVQHYVPVTPGLPASAVAEETLEAAGYERGYGWMKFLRDASPPELPAPEGIDIRLLNEGEGGSFGAIGAAGFGLPDWGDALFAGLPGREGWHCYVASIGGEDVASAALYVEGGIGQFGIAATAEAARGRGCQQALLRHRILEAAAAGCHTLFVETGELAEGKPSGSYRNILRAGFAEAYVRPNWQPAEEA
jgi:GNAT superfamily N-acetyltransferase